MISLAVYDDSLTGTITFPSAEIKRRAMGECNVLDGEVDDVFDGLTVLHAPEDIDLE